MKIKKLFLIIIILFGLFTSSNTQDNNSNNNNNTNSTISNQISNQTNNIKYQIPEFCFKNNFTTKLNEYQNISYLNVLEKKIKNKNSSVIINKNNIKINLIE